MTGILKLYYGIVKKVDSLSGVGPLLIRLVMGYLFLKAGYGKFGNLDGVIGFFNSIGIPFAEIQAPFVAGLELVGGICLILGLFTRFFSIQLVFVMAVAILTTSMDDINSLNDLIKNSEFLNLLLLLILTFTGSTLLSADSVLRKKYLK